MRISKTVDQAKERRSCLNLGPCQLLEVRPFTEGAVRLAPLFTVILCLYTPALPYSNRSQNQGRRFVFERRFNVKYSVAFQLAAISPR